MLKNRTYFIGIISNWCIFPLFYELNVLRSILLILKLCLKKYKKCLSNEEIVRNLILRNSFLDIRNKHVKAYCKHKRIFLFLAIYLVA